MKSGKALKCKINAFVIAAFLLKNPNYMFRMYWFDKSELQIEQI